jgi:hypothetical protein
MAVASMLLWLRPSYDDLRKIPLRSRVVMRDSVLKHVELLRAVGRVCGFEVTETGSHRFDHGKV